MSDPFRLLDLPQETQDRIYAIYLEDAKICIHCCRSMNVSGNYTYYTSLPFSIKATGCPSLTMLCASRKVFQDFQAALIRAIQGIVFIYFSSLDQGREATALKQIAEDLKYEGIRQCARTLHITVGLGIWPYSDFDWTCVVNGFQHISRISLEGLGCDGFDWEDLNELTDNLRNGKYPIDVISEYPFGDSDTMFNIAQALENKLGQGSYWASCYIIYKVYLAEDHEHGGAPSCSSQGHIGVGFSVTPNEWKVCYKYEGLLESFARYEEAIAKRREKVALANASDPLSEHDEMDAD